MNDRTRFKLAGHGMKVSTVLWLCLAAAAISAIVRAVRCALQGRWADAAIMLLAVAACYGIFELSAYVMARLVTNNTKGYRPWTWGMVPRTKEGGSAQEFDIPLTYAQAMDLFIDRAGKGDS